MSRGAFLISTIGGKFVAETNISDYDKLHVPIRVRGRVNSPTWRIIDCRFPGTN